MTESELRDEICRVGESLFNRGYVHATAGNISVRLPESEGGGYLITPTDACLGYLDPKRLARLDSNGQQLSGDRGSKTIALHRKIYAATHDSNQVANCVIHTHSTNCVALTLADTLQAELIPALTPYFVMKVGHVPVIPYHRPGDPLAAELVSDAIREYAKRGLCIHAVMLTRLGPNVWHDSPASAMATLEELEETARLWWMSKCQPSSLSQDAISVLESTFATKW